MNRITHMVVAVLVGIPALAAGMEIGPQLDKNASYSAIRTVSAGGQSYSTLVRRSGADQRLEVERDGHSAVVIVKDHGRKRYMFAPGENVLLELDAQRFNQLAGPEVTLSKARQVGRKTIGGHAATGYHARFKDRTGGMGQGTYWVTGHGILILADLKMDSGETVNIALSDLVVAPQAAMWFEIPAGYTSAMGAQATESHGASYEDNYDTTYGDSNGESYGDTQAYGFKDGAARNGGGIIPSILRDVGTQAEAETRDSLGSEARRGVRKVLGGLFGRKRDEVEEVADYEFDY